ncbi:hypothetical protein D5086_032984 [Populus alba]|uniref:Uncharacterized protein n=1 Tax=Populus alba TaxID=43335 RepID=A0ACC4AFK1_POPAL
MLCYFSRSHFGFPNTLEFWQTSGGESSRSFALESFCVSLPSSSYLLLPLTSLVDRKSNPRFQALSNSCIGKSFSLAEYDKINQRFPASSPASIASVSKLADADNTTLLQ